MAKKIFTCRGKTIEELAKMDMKDFALLMPARQRRSLTRGFTDQQKKLLLKIKKTKEGKWRKPIKTHCRDMVVVPEMIDMTIHIHSGKGFIPLKIMHEMLGHYLGEFTMNRNKVQHSAPGIGATKSSAAASVK